jgi:hypothetical protein
MPSHYMKSPLFDIDAANTTGASSVFWEVLQVKQMSLHAVEEPIYDVTSEQRKKLYMYLRRMATGISGCQSHLWAPSIIITPNSRGSINRFYIVKSCKTTIDGTPNFWEGFLISFSSSNYGRMRASDRFQTNRTRGFIKALGRRYYHPIETLAVRHYLSSYASPWTWTNDGLKQSEQARSPFFRVAYVDIGRNFVKVND